MSNHPLPKFFDATDVTVSLDEGGHKACLYFFGNAKEDDRPLVVTVHTRTLGMLRNRIEQELSGARGPFDPGSKD